LSLGNSSNVAASPNSWSPNQSLIE
jgi:hypothetical protein